MDTSGRCFHCKRKEGRVLRYISSWAGAIKDRKMRQHLSDCIYSAPCSRRQGHELRGAGGVYWNCREKGKAGKSCLGDQERGFAREV